MADEPRARVFGFGFEGPPDGHPTVVVTHRGFNFVLHFRKGDIRGEGELERLEVLPAGKKATLEPRGLREFAPATEVYVAYARASMAMLGSALDEADPEADWNKRFDALMAAAAALMEVGGPGRGLSPEFYKVIAQHYNALVKEGEPHPTKALAAAHHRTASAASRWVTEAKRRGLIKTKEAIGAR